MLSLADLAARAQRLMAPMAVPLTYRVTATYSAKAAASAAIGATVVSIGTLPAGLAGVVAGDQLVMGAQTRTVAADALAVAGTIAAPITVALTTAITSGSAITINRTTDYACKGFPERLDTSTSIAPGVTVGDWTVTVLADTLALAPKIGDSVMADGKARVVKNVGKDPAGCAWVLQCSG